MHDIYNQYLYIYHREQTKSDIARSRSRYEHQVWWRDNSYKSSSRYCYKCTKVAKWTKFTKQSTS